MTTSRAARAAEEYVKDNEMSIDLRHDLENRFMSFPPCKYFDEIIDRTVADVKDMLDVAYSDGVRFAVEEAKKSAKISLIGSPFVLIEDLNALLTEEEK